MNTLPISLYDVMALGLGSGSWQDFVNHYDEKYNVPQIDGFTFAPMQLGYTFQQLVADSGAITLPAYVDPESPGYEDALREIKGITGNIPTMKKYYRLNRTIVRDRLQLIQQVGKAALTQDMANTFTGLLDEGTDGLIGGFMNALTHQRMQIVSTGKFTIDAVVNPRGGTRGVTIDFLDASHRYTANASTKLWWTDAARTTEGSAADPIGDIKKTVRDIRNNKKYIGAMHVEIAKDVYDDLLTHTKVLSKVGLMLYPTATDPSAVGANLASDVVASALNRLCGITIVPKDSVAFVSKVSDGDIVSEPIVSFSKQNIAFVPDGEIGKIHGVMPLTTGYDPDKVAMFNEGRLVLTQRAEPTTHSLYVESEAAQLCVPTATNGMFVYPVTK